MELDWILLDDVWNNQMLLHFALFIAIWQRILFTYLLVVYFWTLSIMLVPAWGMDVVCHSRIIVWYHNGVWYQKMSIFWWDSADFSVVDLLLTYQLPIMSDFEAFCVLGWSADQDGGEHVLITAKLWLIRYNMPTPALGIGKVAKQKRLSC